ncbi:TM2 domain-containing membrane protein YozV [Amorphus suaedae]
MGLSTEQQILIEQRVANDAKSAGAAYLLWFFLGGIGGHRFYLGRLGTAFTMLLLTIGGVATAAFGIGFLLWAIVGIWWVVDAFLIPSIIQKQKDELRRTLGMDALVAGGEVRAPSVDMSKWSASDRARYMDSTRSSVPSVPPRG